MDKKTVKAAIIFYAIIVLFFLILFVNPIKYFKYWMDNDKRIIVDIVDTFCFSNNDGYDLYNLYEYDDCEDSWYDDKDGIYHVYIDVNYLFTNETDIYTTGRYMNYPKKPEISVNGVKVNKVKTENTGNSNIFYFNKLYHFYLETPIELNKVYKIEVKCDTDVKTTKIMFHEDVDSSEISKSEIIYYTANGSVYHLNKDCRYLNDSMHISEGTIKYCGKYKCCETCLSTAFNY